MSKPVEVFLAPRKSHSDIMREVESLIEKGGTINDDCVLSLFVITANARRANVKLIRSLNNKEIRLDIAESIILERGLDLRGQESEPEGQDPPSIQ